MDISDLLADKGLEPEKLMPFHRPSEEVILLNQPNQDPAPFPAFLALHFFDNEDYEIWTPQEWLKKGIDGNLYRPVPGKALLPNLDSNEFGKDNYKLTSCISRIISFYFFLFNL